MPEISVLMCVYNGERYLRRAVDSLLEQTFSDFELLIVDDCSTDTTPAILDSYTDDRIVRLRNEQNLGLTLSLNRGLDAATGRYIARMDADDICFPQRLQVQYIYMQAHPEIGLLGSCYVAIDDDGSIMDGGKIRPGGGAPPVFAAWRLLSGTTITHPTAMIRRSILETHSLRYDPAFKVAQDYDLWERINRVTDVARLPDALIYYRISMAAISHKRKGEQEEAHRRVCFRQWDSLVPFTLSEDTKFLMLAVMQARYSIDVNPAMQKEDIQAACDAIVYLSRHFLAKSGITPYEKHRILLDTVRYILSLNRYTGRYRSGITALLKLPLIPLSSALVNKALKRI